MTYRFGDCELDTERFELRRGGVRRHVEPQVFDVLAYLLAHRDRVVTRDELLAQVWGHSYVSEATLSSRLMAVRKAVGDSGRAQSLIRTIRGRGYRFAGAVEEVVAAMSAAAPASALEEATSAAPGPSVRATPSLIGRDAQLAELRLLLDASLAGARQLVLVTGEAGAGKTTLVESFVDAITAADALLAGIGRCVELRGPVEPYMPLLKALGRLCRGPAGAQVVEILARIAPTWLVQMPAVAAPSDLEAAYERTLGAGPERMLREIVEALDALSAQVPVVLFLDDLHWSDEPTLALLAHMARREEAARLLVIATARPGHHPPVEELRRELRARGRCVELTLPPLSPQAVRDYLEHRYRGAEALAPLVHARTDGNPLFMECLLGAWAEDRALTRGNGGWRVERDREELVVALPATLRELLEQDADRLDPDDEGMLEAAAVVGTEFSAAAVAAGAGLEPEEVEQRCAQLARRGRFLREAGTDAWPDGTVAAAFAFVHDLHRQVLYERIPAGRRARLHRDIAARLEAGYGGEAPQRAAELATHFLAGREPAAAVRYLELAAAQALARGSFADGIRHLRTALELLAEAPALAEREWLELSLQATLAGALLATEGWASRAAEEGFRRALELARGIGDTASVAMLLQALGAVNEYRGDHAASEALLEEALGLVGDAQGVEWHVQAHELIACSLFHQGSFAAAIEQAERGLALDRPDHRHPVAAQYGEHPAVACNVWSGLSLACLGDSAESLRRIRTALELAADPGRVYSLATAELQTARLHQLRGEPDQALAHADATVALATERGFPLQAAMGSILGGWARALLGRPAEGVESLRAALAAYRAIGAEIDVPYYLALLAEAQLAGGQPADALVTIAEAQESVGAGRTFFYEAELHRLHGELTLAAEGEAGAGTAAESFRRALSLARRHDARSLELRAAVSLARLLLSQGSRDEAERVLREPCEWFGDGGDIPDLREARALMDDLRVQIA